MQRRPHPLRSGIRPFHYKPFDHWHNSPECSARPLTAHFSCGTIRFTLHLAIFSDVHGNFTALRAVFQDIAARGPFDRIIIAGDLAWGGPAPQRVLEKLIELDALCVMGNMDAYLLGAASPIPTMEETLHPRAHPVTQWMCAQLTNTTRDFLMRLPFAYRVEPDPRGRLLIVHANVHNVDDSICPDAPDAEIRPLIENANADVIAYGHTHINGQRQVDETRLVNVSSAGKPADGDTRAAWDEFDWDAKRHRWKITVHRVAYDIEATVREMYAVQRPEPEKWIRQLRAARWK